MNKASMKVAKEQARFIKKICSIFYEENACCKGCIFATKNNSDDEPKCKIGYPVTWNL